jgi:hypothetical protein
MRMLMKEFSENRQAISSLQSILVRARPRLCRAVPFATLFCFLSWCFISVRSNFDWDDADPEVLNSAWRLAKGESIYHGIETPPYSFAAYTPLYYALTALLLKFTGLSYLPAKLLTFLFALSIGYAMVRLSRLWKKTARDGLWSACLFFLIPAVLFNTIRCHAQMMAVAFSIWSLVFFLRDRRFPTLVVSPLFAVAAFYAKQTQIALPLAMLLYLALRKRRWLLPYAAVGAVAGMIPLFLLQKATGGYFLFDIVRLAGISYDARQIIPVFLHWAGPAMLLLAVASIASWKRFRLGSWEPLDCYLACLLLITPATLGRAGAHSQYVVELLAVTLIFLLRTTGLPAIQGRDALVALQTLFLIGYSPAFVFIEEGPRDLSSIRAAQKIYPMLQQGSGPILSQQGSFALFSRGEIYTQLFHFTGLARVGLWDQRPLLKEIENHKFSWVITEFPLEGAARESLDEDAAERFTPEMVVALQQNYRRRETIYPYYLYSPRAP